MSQKAKRNRNKWAIKDINLRKRMQCFVTISCLNITHEVWDVLLLHNTGVHLLDKELKVIALSLPCCDVLKSKLSIVLT